MATILFRAFNRNENKMTKTFVIGSQLSNIFEGVLMQYTGLNDKNDNPIFEGDILQEIYEDKAEDSGFGKTTVEVVFRNGAFGWIGDITKKFYSFDSEPLDNFEIIGNIYENPELINTGA